MEMGKCSKAGLSPESGLLNICQHPTAVATESTPLSLSHARPQGHPGLASCFLNALWSVTGTESM